MIPTPAETALALSQSTEVAFLIKATAALLIGLSLVALTRRTRASVRHLILAATFATLVATPVVGIALPETTIAIPVAADPAPTATSAAETLGTAVTPAVDGTPAQTAAAPARSRLPWRTVLQAVWAIGAILFVVPVAASLWTLRSLRRRSLPWPEQSGFVEALAIESGVRRHLEILRHEEVASPITFGIRRPAILMPMEASAWSQADLRRALVHEIEHVRRGDWIVHLTARLACAAYWFHPLAWVAWRQLILDAERSCDDAVVARDEGADYAEQLVTLAQTLTGTAEPALGMAHRSDLAARVSALLDEARPRGRAGIGLAAVTIASTIVIVLGLAPLRAVAVARSPEDGSSAAGDADMSILVPEVYRRYQRVFVGDRELSMGGLLELVRRERPATVLVRGEERTLLRDLTQVMELLKQAGVAQVALAQQPRQPRRLRALDRELVEAAGGGDLEDVKDLIDAGANVDAAVDGDGSPLIAAARANRLAVVTELLNHGADVNLAVSGDGNPLIAAAAAGSGPVVDLLLSKGAAIDLVVPGDENALIQAAGNGHFFIVQMLVERGADVNARVLARRQISGGQVVEEWRTPLSQARRGRHDQVVAFLLHAGAKE